MKLITWKYSDNSAFGIWGLFQDDMLAGRIYEAMEETCGDFKTFEIHDVEFMDTGRFIIKANSLDEEILNKIKSNKSGYLTTADIT